MGLLPDERCGVRRAFALFQTLANRLLFGRYFTQWKAPDNFKIELFVIRVGDWGGYMLLDCDDPLAVHKFCSMLPAFEFQARPVVPVMDAVRVELEAVAFRDGLQSAQARDAGSGSASVFQGEEERGTYTRPKREDDTISGHRRPPRMQSERRSAELPEYSSSRRPRA